MTTKWIDVEFVSLYAKLFEFEIHQYTAFRRHTIISSMRKETRWGFLGYPDLGKKLVPLLSIHEIGWVNENPEVRTAGQFIRAVDFWIGSRAEGRQAHHGQVASRRKPKNAQAIHELTNTAGKDVALDGVIVFGDDGDPWVISPEGWVMADGESWIFCFDDTVLGLDCDYVYGTDVNAASALDATFSASFNLGNSYGGLAVVAQDGTFVDILEWTPGTAGWPAQALGSSWVVDPASADATSNDDGANWCYPTAADTLSSGDFGTPGSVEACQVTAP